MAGEPDNVYRRFTVSLPPDLVREVRRATASTSSASAARSPLVEEALREYLDVAPRMAKKTARPEMAGWERLTVVLPPDVADRAKRAAVDAGVALNQIVVTAVRTRLERTAAAPAEAVAETRPG